jgi:glucose/arabinose dehydrogenase
MVKSYAFQPWGKTPPDDGAVRGTIKASGTILRMNPDGSDLEVYAWGLRNPFGVMWGPDGKLYASDNGYDERGSRPIAHAPDLLWVVKKDAWYGFPDYAGGVPVTDARFRPEHGPAPKFLMRDHPPVEKPLATLTHHVGAAKIDFARGDGFGFPGQLFLALSGDMNPVTGHHDERSGFEVVRIDPATGKGETFFKAKKEALGPKGFEYVTTAGPRRPVDVRFSPDGKTLYVVDVGSVALLSTATGPTPRPFPGSGVVWRVTRSETAPK